MKKTNKDFISVVKKALAENGNDTDVDSAALYMLEKNYKTFVEATAIVEKEGFVIPCADGSLKEHPANKIARDAEAMALRIMTEYGLTLKSRKKLQTVETEEETPLEQYLKGTIEKR